MNALSVVSAVEDLVRLIRAISDAAETVGALGALLIAAHEERRDMTDGEMLAWQDRRNQALDRLRRAIEVAP